MIAHHRRTTIHGQKTARLYLNTLDTVRAVEKLVAFYVQEHNSRLPHSAFRGQTPDEIYFKTGDRIPEELEAARQKARQARAEANRKQDCESCELLATSLN
jgi:putative transposase